MPDAVSKSMLPLQDAVEGDVLEDEDEGGGG
jgi:hypothetical protein